MTLYRGNSIEIVSLVKVESGSGRKMEGEEGREYGSVESITRVGLMHKLDSECSGKIVPCYWWRGMVGGEGVEKRRWKRLGVVVVEEDGEEEGMVDGIVWMINNPLIKDGFGGFDRGVFGDGDVDEYTHSLKRLYAFVG